MIDYLELQDVGPARRMRLDLAPRLNLLTGDNGAGKSFLLDVAWFVAAKHWSRMPALPRRNRATRPTIAYRLAGSPAAEAAYLNGAMRWFEQDTTAAGIVLYARVDGTFAVLDEARQQSWRGQWSSEALHLGPFGFEVTEVWDGLEREGKTLCNGLIRDWVSWQREGRPLYQQFCQALERLSPDEELPLVPGEPVRVSLDDARDIPTIHMPYGDVPVTHAAAGMRRILALTYLLVWTWAEHLEACRLRDLEPSKHLLVLVDEVETHLHPQWQRRLLPALVEVVSGLSESTQVQLIASTHAPLVLASLEPIFDPERDALFNLDLRGEEAVVEKLPWERHGDASTWLMSEVFDLDAPYSVEVEQAMNEAIEVARQRDAQPAMIRAAHQRLAELLDERDPFWRRWRPYAAKAGIEL